MGHEIVYCSKCQNRLLPGDFERGTGLKSEGVASCDKCSADVIKLLPAEKIQEFLREIARVKKTAPPPPPAVRIVPVVPKTSRAVAARKSLSEGAWIGIAV